MSNIINNIVSIILILCSVGLLGIFASIIVDCIIGEPVFRKKYKEFKKQQEEYITWTDYERVDMYCLSKYNRKRIKEFPTITFEQFEDFYYLNPSSWQLNDLYVTKNNDKNLSFTFEYSEWKKYKKFKKEIAMRKEIKRRLEEKAKLKKQQDEITIKILEEVQKDIDNIRAESMKNFENARELIIKACEE